jgi:glutathione synthase/RimK-type ligase-like ATP-grasp enzyme
MLLSFVRRLGLMYGAIDMRRTPDGDHVFLEVNPAGQWLFVEQRTGQPIAARIADLLISA